MRKKKHHKTLIHAHPGKIYPMEGDPRDMRAWLDDQLEDKPLVIELGMGSGDFLVYQAKNYPEKFFLGIEMKADRVYRAFQKAETEELNNIAFAHINIQELENYHLPQAAQIYALFSDPWPKKRHTGRRLSSPEFLRLYENILIPTGHLEIKTDDGHFYSYSLASLHRSGWEIIEKNPDKQTPLAQQTKFEKKWRSLEKPIGYIKTSPPKQKKVDLPRVYFTSHSDTLLFAKCM